MFSTHINQSLVSFFSLQIRTNANQIRTFVAPILSALTTWGPTSAAASQALRAQVMTGRPALVRMLQLTGRQEALRTRLFYCLTTQKMNDPSNSPIPKNSRCIFQGQ